MDARSHRRWAVVGTGAASPGDDPACRTRWTTAEGQEIGLGPRSCAIAPACGAGRRRASGDQAEHLRPLRASGRRPKGRSRSRDRAGDRRGARGRVWVMARSWRSAPRSPSRCPSTTNPRRRASPDGRCPSSSPRTSADLLVPREGVLSERAAAMVVRTHIGPSLARTDPIDSSCSTSTAGARRPLRECWAEGGAAHPAIIHRTLGRLRHGGRLDLARTTCDKVPLRGAGARRAWLWQGAGRRSTSSNRRAVLDLRTRRARVRRARRRAIGTRVRATEVFRNPARSRREAAAQPAWGYDRDPGSNVVTSAVGYLLMQARRGLIVTARGWHGRGLTRARTVRVPSTDERAPVPPAHLRAR
jgi:hypothetical protein